MAEDTFRTEMPENTISLDDLLSIDKKNCAVSYEELKWVKVTFYLIKIIFSARAL